jgi:hypothetical protein
MVIRRLPIGPRGPFASTTHTSKYSSEHDALIETIASAHADIFCGQVLSIICVPNVWGYDLVCWQKGWRMKIISPETFNHKFGGVIKFGPQTNLIICF